MPPSAMVGDRSLINFSRLYQGVLRSGKQQRSSGNKFHDQYPPVGFPGSLMVKNPPTVQETQAMQDSRV